ncbi:MAG: hypothetical protein EOO02_22710 [Chitinophagaceae bacterium]|nr:MAG: hypothetical protein EOO02_22710 [Chitinophagaceae bacterium]
MYKLLFFLVAVLVCFGANAQKQNSLKSVRSFFDDAGIKPTKVMLLGTFHFAYQNLDVHKTTKKNQRDILSAKSQQELQKVLDVVRTYKPTRIYLEAKDQSWLDSCYRVCNDSTFKTQPNERVQIGFRLARELKLQKVYAVDSENLINEWYVADSVLLMKLLGSDSVADKSHADLLNKTYGKYYEYVDSICANAPLIDGFRYMNETESLKLNHGAYLSGYFNTIGNYGPDFLASWWIDRNLRIYNNVMLSKPSPDDRLLILFGFGHIPLLKHNFESSPEFEVVDFNRLASPIKK